MENIFYPGRYALLKTAKNPNKLANAIGCQLISDKFNVQEVKYEHLCEEKSYVVITAISGKKYTVNMGRIIAICGEVMFYASTIKNSIMIFVIDQENIEIFRLTQEWRVTKNGHLYVGFNDRYNINKLFKNVKEVFDKYGKF